MRLLVTLALFCTLLGCAELQSTRDITQRPSSISQYAVVYFSSPSGTRVRVYEIEARGNGLSITDYVEIPEPVYLLPGKTLVTFACPDAEVYTYDNKGDVNTRRAGTYFLRCSAEGKLVVAPRRGG